MAGLQRMLDGDRLNLEKVHFLLVDDNAHALTIISHVISSFGGRQLSKCSSAAAAKEVIARGGVDIVLTDAQMPDETGYDLTEWIRKEAADPARFVPIVIITGHTPESDVTRGRDVGANFTVAKPLVPRVLLQRLLWLGQDDRQFVQAANYVGPDRRYKLLGPPAGTVGRRDGDIISRDGEAGPSASDAQKTDPMNELAKVSP